jgi:hypothetical protein
MAQATILAAAKTAATSTDLTVASAATATLGIFTDAAAGIPSNEFVRVYQDTPSEDLLIDTLSGANPTMTIPGPGTYRASRPVTTTNIGVFTEGA